MVSSWCWYGKVQMVTRLGIADNDYFGLIHWQSKIIEFNYP
jgi:hypothetical protein